MSWVTLRALWVTLRARWVTLRARCLMFKARWVTFRCKPDFAEPVILSVDRGGTTVENFCNHLHRVRSPPQRACRC